MSHGMSIHISISKCHKIEICFCLYFAGKKADLYDRVNPDWVPSVNMTSRSLDKGLMSPRYQRRKQRTERKKDYAAAESLLLLQESDEETTGATATGTETQTELTEQLISSMTSELQKLRSDNMQLSQQVEESSHKYDKVAFEGRDEKVLYYTGLPTFKILLTLFVYLEPFLPIKKSLNKISNDYFDTHEIEIEYGGIFFII